MGINDLAVPAYSIEAEQSVLGSILVDYSAATESAQILVPEDFYREEHRIIFNAILSLLSQSKPVDLVALSEELGAEKLKSAGGITYLARLAESVPNSANVAYYAQIVRRDARIRSAYLKSGEVEEAMKEKDLERIREIGLEIARIAVVDNKKAFSDLFTADEFQRLASLPRWRSNHLNVITNILPFQLGEQIVIAGKTSTGKTQVGLNLAMDFIEQGARVAYVSLEVVKKEFLRRIILFEVGTDKSDSISLRDVDLRQKEWQTLGLDMLKQKKYKNLLFTDELSDIQDIKGWLAGVKPDVAIIDYIQLIKNGKTGLDKYRTITSVAEEIRTNLTRDMCVVVLSQMNRSKLDEPDLSQLSGSGSIEQTATGIVFLEKNIEDPSLFRFRIMKNQSNGDLIGWTQMRMQRNGAFDIQKFAVPEQ